MASFSIATLSTISELQLMEESNFTDFPSVSVTCTRSKIGASASCRGTNESSVQIALANLTAKCDCGADFHKVSQLILKPNIH